MKDAPIAGGYILLSRKIIESEIMKKPPLYLKVWLWLLLNAQHSEYKGMQRGQFRTSIPEIISAMSHKIGYRTVKPTKKEIYGIIEWLRNPHEGYNEGNMIVTTKVTHGFVYDVVKYDFYQDPSNYEGNNEGITKELRRSNIGNNNNKNDKNDKNIVDVGGVYSFYQQNIGLISSHQQQTIGTYLDDGLDPELIIEAMKDSIGADNPWRYLNRILNNCTTQSVYTLDEYNSKKVERKNKSISDQRKIERARKKEEDDAAMQRRALEELREAGEI